MMMRGTARLVLGALFVAAVCSHGRVANAEDGAEAADSVEARMAAAAAEDEAGGPAEPAAAAEQNVDGVPAPPPGPKPVFAGVGENKELDDKIRREMAATVAESDTLRKVKATGKTAEEKAAFAQALADEEKKRWAASGKKKPKHPNMYKNKVHDTPKKKKKKKTKKKRKGKKKPRTEL